MSRSAIGIDIGGTSIKAGIVDEQGRLLHTQSIPTEAGAGKAALLNKILALVSAYRQYGGVNVAAVGIGTAGFVDYRTGTIAGATGNLPGWGGTPLKQYVQAHTGLPIAVDNDINAIAVGEGWIGAGRSLDDFVCIAIGTGIGGSLVIGGEPYRGRDGFAGVYGHQIIVHGGRSCTCGKKGCWEPYASVTALKRMAADVFGEQSELAISPIRLFEAARAGEEAAIAIVDEYTEWVAVGLTQAIHALNPRTIVIGGAISAQGEFLLTRIRRHVRELTLPVFWSKRPVDIVPAQLGEQAGVIGAARLAFAVSIDG